MYKAVKPEESEYVIVFGGETRICTCFGNDAEANANKIARALNELEERMKDHNGTCAWIQMERKQAYECGHKEGLRKIKEIIMYIDREN